MYIDHVTDCASLRKNYHIKFPHALHKLTLVEVHWSRQNNVREEVTRSAQVWWKLCLVRDVTCDKIHVTPPPLSDKLGVSSCVAGNQSSRSMLEFPNVRGTFLQPTVSNGLVVDCWDSKGIVLITIKSTKSED